MRTKPETQPTVLPMRALVASFWTTTAASPYAPTSGVKKLSLTQASGPVSSRP